MLWNINKIRNNLYLFAGLISLLLLGILLGLFWDRGVSVRPPSGLTTLPEVEVVPQIPQSSASAYQINARLPEAKSLAVYNYSFPQGDYRERALSFAQALGFAGEPEVRKDFLYGTSFYFEKGARVLRVDSKASRVSYSIDIAADEAVLEGSFLPSPKQAAAIVERTARDLGGYSPLLEFTPEKTKFLKRGSSRPLVVASADAADFLEVRFSAKINDYQLYLDSGYSFVDPLVAWVGKDGTLLNLQYTLVGQLKNKVGDYPLKNREDVLADLQTGKGTIVSSSFLGKPEITSMTITQISLGYLLPLPDVNVIQPIYVLTGTAQDKSGERVSLTIYLPAVREL